MAERIREEPNVNHVTTVSDTIKRLNKAMNRDDEKFYAIPANRELAAQYLLLYELSVPFGLDLNNRMYERLYPILFPKRFTFLPFLEI